MKTLKKLTIWGVILIIVHLLLWTRSAKEREWASQIMERYAADGWAVAGKFTGYGDVDGQLTRIMSPVKDVWFTKDKEIKILIGGIYSAPIFHVSYDNGQTIHEEGIQLFDASSGKGAYLQNQRDLKSIDKEQIRWVSYGPRDPGAEIIKYIKYKVGR